MRKLLTVTETFGITGRGVIVGPGVDEAEARHERVEVELRLANGERRALEAHIQVPFINPPPPAPSREAWVVLLGVKKSDVPIGSELWLVERRST